MHWPCQRWLRLGLLARAVVLVRLRNVSAQVQGIAEAHHDGASGWAADPIKMVPYGFDGSAALNGVRQMQGLSHGLTLEGEIVLRKRGWT